MKLLEKIITILIQTFRYTTTPINLEGNDIDLKQFQPTRPAYTDVTIKATASRPLIGPQRRPPKRPVVIENRPPSTIKTPQLRPFARPSPPPIPTESPEPEVLFAGQAFDIDPSRPPQARPEIFDLTVSVKQNFGGNRAPSQNNGESIFHACIILEHFLVSESVVLYGVFFFFLFQNKHYFRWDYYQSYSRRGPVCIH